MAPALLVEFDFRAFRHPRRRIIVNRVATRTRGSMIPNAIEFRNQYKTLKMPVGIIAGEGDRIIDIDQQSARLHQDIPHSKFYRIPAAGHMVHQTAPHAMMAAINDLLEPARKHDAS
jgi:pimeloyl-ACP methyl ester carboxylesterase